MYYCHNRFYNPKWRRWLTPDSPNYLYIDTPSGMNLFIYCNNNPVMYSDGDGHMPEWLRGLCVLGDATLIVAAITVATVATGGAAAPVLIGAAVGAGVSGSVSAVCLRSSNTVTRSYRILTCFPLNLKTSVYRHR